MQEDKTCHIL